jgi:hypothetical protein
MTGHRLELAEEIFASDYVDHNPGNLEGLWRARQVPETRWSASSARRHSLQPLGRSGVLILRPRR